MSTLLIIDDSDSQRAQIRAALADDRIFDSILEATNGFEGLRMLLAESVDVVLCDLELPGLDGEKLLCVNEQRTGRGEVPFVFLTGTTDLDRKARLLDGGASDTIAKPFHPADLVARLKLHLKVKRLQEELRLKNDELRVMSQVDDLTQLATRRYVFDRLSIEFMRAERYGTPLAIVMADLDHFKLLNDKYGHPAGDAVLAGTAARLREAVRATDIAGRYGGEEIFVVLQSDLDGATLMAERWRKQVARARYELPDGNIARVTVSIGVAQYEATMESPDELIALADQMLYRAKENGRNRVEC